MNWGWGTCTAFSWRDASVWLVCLCSNTHKHRQSDLLYYSRTSRWCSPPADTRFQNNTTKQPTACRALGKRTTNWKQRTRQTHSKTPTEVRAARTGPPGEGRRTTAPSQAAPHAALSPAAANGRAARPGQVSGRGLRRAGGRRAAWGVRPRVSPSPAPCPCPPPPCQPRKRLPRPSHRRRDRDRSRPH